MNSVVRRPSTTLTSHTPDRVVRRPSTTLTSHTPDESRHTQSPIVSKGKTMRDRKDSKNVAGKGPKQRMDSSDLEDTPTPSVTKASPLSEGKRDISSVLSDSEEEGSESGGKSRQVTPPVARHPTPPPAKQAMPTPAKQDHPSTLWKEDGMLNTSSSEGSDREEGEGRRSNDKPAGKNLLNRLKSIFSDSESEEEVKPVLERKQTKPHPPHTADKSGKKPNKRQVFSDSDSSDDDQPRVKPNKPDSKKGLSHGDKGKPLTDRESPHRDHDRVKPKYSSGGLRNHTSDQGTKRSLDHDKEEDSVAKKLRLIDIDFTGGKMRPPPSQTKPPSSKLTPLKKLRLQSQKNHHGPMSKPKLSDGKLHPPKKDDGGHKLGDKKGGVSTHKVKSPEKSWKHLPSVKDSHHQPKSHLFKKSHDSVKRPHDSSKRSHDSGKELFAHKDAILAAKFPQKRNLVSDHPT